MTSGMVCFEIVDAINAVVRPAECRNYGAMPKAEYEEKIAKEVRIFRANDSPLAINDEVIEAVSFLKWDDVANKPAIATATHSHNANFACNGTDKVKSFDANGIPVCGSDVTGAGGSTFREFTLIHAAVAHTNLGAAFGETAVPVSRNRIDLTGVTEVRIVFVMSVAAVTGDVKVQYATTANYASPVDLVTVLNPTATNVMWESPWTPVNELGDVYVRVGMLAGNGTEDPSIRFLKLQVR
jgi:hypothetical protein